MKTIAIIGSGIGGVPSALGAARKCAKKIG